MKLDKIDRPLKGEEQAWLPQHCDSVSTVAPSQRPENRGAVDLLRVILELNVDPHG